jgi:hypothetical protein
VKEEITMKRPLVDLIPVAALVVLSRIAGANFEGVRMAILAGVFALVAVLALLRVISREAQRGISIVAAATLLALAWFQSFPAWSHSVEVGAYLLAGVLTLVIAMRGGRKVALAS